MESPVRIEKLTTKFQEALALLESNQNRYQELVEPVETFELLENLAFQ
jgi:hypothetical protein